MTVMSITTARNNGELIAQAAQLGYLQPDWYTLDPTYGLGRFWTVWRPQRLVATDLDPTKSPSGQAVDFTALPFEAGVFDAVVLDGPYKLNGTSTGKGAATSDSDYGVQAWASWQDRHALIRAGITEAHRVLRPGGMLLVKAQDQVCGGRKRWQTREFADHAESLGARLVDMLHLPGHRPQPPGRRQVHALQNFSTLLIIQKDGRP